MKQKRTPLFRMFVLGVAAASVLGLAGCAQPAGSDSDTLTIWTRADGEQYMKDLTAIYNESNPDLTIKVTAIPNSDVQTKLGSAISANDAPDVVAIDVVKAPYFISVGAFEDLTERISGLDYADSLLEAQLEAGTFEGKNYTVPFTSDASVLFYNKDLFTQAGLNPDTPPTTWDEFAEAANTISALGHDNVGYHFSAGCGGCSAFALAPMVWAAGGDFIDGESGSLNPDGTFDDPIVKDFVTMMNGMVADGGITKSSQVDGGENYGGSFESGKLGMVAGGSFYLSQLQSTPPPFEVGVTPLPGKTSGEIASFSGGDVLAIPSAAKNADAAWDFLQWATGDEAQTRLAETGYTPVRTDLYETVYSTKGPEWASLAEATMSGNVPLTQSFNAIFSDPNGPMISLMQSGVFGSDIPAAIASAQKTAQQIVDQGSNN